MSVKSRIDIVSLVAGLLLATTVIAFAAGMTPYPYGFFILSFVLLGRFLQLQSSHEAGVKQADSNRVAERERGGDARHAAGSVKQDVDAS